jgi:hypothetical protein
MLFDRLVFPVPQKAYSDGPEHEPGSVEWRVDDTEWKRWSDNKWEPERQQELLKLIEKVVRRVSWDSTRQDEWRTEVAKVGAGGGPNSAFGENATRTVLTRDLPAFVTGVSALGPRYSTVEEMRKQLRIQNRRGKLPAAALGTVLAWEFLVPDDDSLSDDDLLKATIEFVTGDSDFRTHRRAFTAFQQSFIREGKTDDESIKLAVSKMHELLNQAKTTTTQLKIRKSSRYACRIVPGAIALGAAVAHAPIVASAAAVFFAVSGVSVDEWLFKKAEGSGPAPTAFVHDARRHFGWKKPSEASDITVTRLEKDIPVTRHIRLP